MTKWTDEQKQAARLRKNERRKVADAYWQDKERAMSKEAMKRAFIAGCLSNAIDQDDRSIKFETWYDNEFMAIVQGLPAVGANRREEYPAEKAP